MKKTLVLLSFLLSLGIKATTVAIIDSGLDVEHQDFAGKIWVNEKELNGIEGVDDDGNGLVDDINGYDFEHKTGVLLDRTNIGLLTPFIQDYFQMQSQAEYFKLGYNSMSEEDFRWYQKNLGNPKAYEYGHFSHGTHVAGIAAKDNPNIKLIGIKKGLSEVNLTPVLIKQISNYNVTPLAEVETQFLRDVATYLDKVGARVANGSFGTVYFSVINRFYTVFQNSRPIAEIKYIAQLYQKKLLEKQEEALSLSPNTLYVFAAGNNGLDNDVNIFTPANVNKDNAITVAATVDRNHLPEFSCYGKKTVHVAAPGVGIESTVPGGDHMQMTGTSQAAPFVTNVAARIIDENESLTSGDVKNILIETVDKKDFLENAVISGGIVNEVRAIYAAKLSTSMDVESAIKLSLEEIDDL